jgi:hypothetical protein
MHGQIFDLQRSDISREGIGKNRNERRHAEHEEQGQMNSQSDVNQCGLVRGLQPGLKKSLRKWGGVQYYSPINQFYTTQPQ